ncbi:hypothetical protein [Nocardia cerradoensis]|uniref:Uncharacterized protein n=1 Tax=Nocardia cerradoensis TaxID=85688 RepID=A0A231GV04_9NOCA|nr:hypothetical protein [Nocardia cerradoensis]NKY43617.1 hypothetical protein [Nocardia cerradoensis]OXR40454.1 hypothetical protein B7C42_07512 [Nocardia cerradoensis]
MFSERAFFSFIEMTAPDRHREYNQWHQLDHRPENLLLPGVAWGDRWQRRRHDGAADCASGELANTDYVAMYWFRPPYEQSIAEWDELGEDSFQWGRGPMLPGIRRSLLAFFTPVKGYVAPRVLVSADALPFRPNRGLHVRVDHIADPHGPGAHEQFRWQDQVRIPDLLSCSGVAGAWTFALQAVQQHRTLPLGEGRREYPSGSLHIRLLYLDDDPVTVTQDIAEREKQWDTAGRGAPCREAEETIFSAAVHTIVPWQDW